MKNGVRLQLIDKIKKGAETKMKGIKNCSHKKLYMDTFQISYN